MTKKKTTTEDLARMVQEGFSGVRHEIDGVKRDIKDEVAGLEKRLSNRIDDLEVNLSANSSRAREDMEKLEETTRNHEKRISRLEVRSRK